MLLMQHLKHPPNLGSLAVADQPIIAQALAKKPAERFKTCTEMIDALRAAGRQPLPAPAADTSDAVSYDTQTPPQETAGVTLIIPKKHQLPPLPAAAAADYKSRSTVDIACPSCGFAGRVPKKYQGQKVKCPQCSIKFRVEVIDPDYHEPEPETATLSPVRAAETTVVRVPGKTTQPIPVKTVECPVCGNHEKLPEATTGQCPLLPVRLRLSRMKPRRPLPTAADLAAPPVHLQAGIPESYLDEMGHMNVMWYTHLFSRSSGVLFEKLGLDAAHFAANQAGTFALETHVRYLAELRVGKQVTVRSRMLARSERVIHYMHFLIRDDGLVLSAIGEHIAAHIDMTCRRTAPFPAAIAATIDRVIAEHAALPWPAPTCGVMSVAD